MSNQRIWYLWTADGQQGPYTAEELLAWKYAGKITDDWYVWREGFSDWKRIAEILELSTTERVLESAPHSETVQKEMKGLGWTEKGNQKGKEVEHKTEGVIYCGKCGAQNPHPSKFCNECGAQFNSNQPISNQESHQTGTQRRSIIPEMGICVVLVLLLAVFIPPLLNRVSSTSKPFTSLNLSRLQGNKPQTLRIRNQFQLSRYNC